MSELLTDLALYLASELGPVHNGTTTGIGSTTTAVDTALKKAAGYYNNGPLWILSGTYDGETADVSNQTAGGTITFAPALAGAVASGVSYSVGSPRFTRSDLQDAINRAARKTKVLTRDAAHTISSGVITLSAGVKDVMQVWVDDVRNYRWNEVGGTIRFANADITGDVVIYYLARHADLDWAGTVPLHSSINRDWVLAAAQVNAWRSYLQTVEEDDPTAINMFNESLKLEKETGNMYVEVHKKDPRHSDW
jgi:hypothetical protein